MTTTKKKVVKGTQQLIKENQNVLESTQQIIKTALVRLGVGEAFYELLKEPLRQLTVRIPVKMDDGTVSVFTGY